MGKKSLHDETWNQTRHSKSKNNFGRHGCNMTPRTNMKEEGLINLWRN